MKPDCIVQGRRAKIVASKAVADGWDRTHLPQRLQQERGGKITGDIPHDQRVFHTRRGYYGSKCRSRHRRVATRSPGASGREWSGGRAPPGADRLGTAGLYLCVLGHLEIIVDLNAEVTDRAPGY